MDQLELIERGMQEYTELLYRIAYYYVKDSYVAEDIVQDVFVRLYTSNYQEQGNLRAYLSRMTANACKDYLRSWSYRKIQFTTKLLFKEKTVQKDGLVRKDELNALDEAILSLPIKQREAIVYYYLEDLSVKEIAELLGRPESTIKSRLSAGKEQLQNMLAKEEWEVLLNE